MANVSSRIGDFSLQSRKVSDTFERNVLRCVSRWRSSEVGVRAYMAKLGSKMNKVSTLIPYRSM